MKTFLKKHGAELLRIFRTTFTQKSYTLSIGATNTCLTMLDQLAESLAKLQAPTAPTYNALAAAQHAIQVLNNRLQPASEQARNILSNFNSMP